MAYADIAKGYETENGEMVILTDEDMAELPLTSSREIAVESFVPSNQIDPMLFEKSYYLEPEKSGAKPYALLRQALIDADRMAVVTVALRQRTSTAVLRVRDDVIVMQTMMWPDEVRQPDFKIETGEIKDAEVKMAHMLVETLAGDFDVDDFKDDYADAVEELVKAKVEGGEVKKTKTAAKSSGEVVDLLAALQRSVDAAKTARGEETEKEEPKKTPAKKAAAKKTATKKASREEACQEEGQLGPSANGSVGLEHRLQVAANPRRHGPLSMHGPVQLRAVHGGLKRRCQPFRRAGNQLVGCHGVLNELTDAGVHRPRAFERVTVEVWLGQIEAKEGQRVGDLLRGRAQERHTVRQPEERPDRGSVPGAQAVEDVGGPARGVRGRGEQQAALGSETVYDGRSRYARLLSHVGQREPTRSEASDGPEGGPQELLVTDLTGTGAHGLDRNWRLSFVLIS